MHPQLEIKQNFNNMKSKLPIGKSKGLGDTVTKITHALGLDKVADVIAKVAGKEDCGCGRRQNRLNDLFPYMIETKDKPTVIPPPPLDELEGNYEILQPIRFTLEDGNPIDLTVGSILPIDKNHPLYKDAEYYHNNSIIKKINNE